MKDIQDIKNDLNLNGHAILHANLVGCKLDGNQSELEALKESLGIQSESIQVVEIAKTVTNLPQTGTLTDADLDKLASDNCVLIFDGSVFHKSFESTSGIDYKKLGLTSYMNGVESVYFTVSKSSREYTIAKTSPIEANHQLAQNQAPSSMNNLKVGNTTYAVPEIILVEGTLGSGNNFVPDSNQPTYTYCADAFDHGASLTLKVTDSGTTIHHRVYQHAVTSALAGMDYLVAPFGDDTQLIWSNPEATGSNLP